MSNYQYSSWGFGPVDSGRIVPHAAAGLPNTAHMERAEMNTSRLYHWSATWNNHPENWAAILEDLVRRDVCKYIIAGEEIGAEGTPHLQMHVYFREAKLLRQARRHLPDAYLLPIRTTNEQSINYCKKGQRYREFGPNPIEVAAVRVEAQAQAQRDDWAEIKAQARAGNYDAIDPRVYIRYHSALRKIGNEFSEVPRNFTLGRPCGVWICGPVNVGKTTTTCNAFPVHYKKNSSAGKWWDGYGGEECVICDEMSIQDARDQKGLLKLWGDAPACNVEIKGGTIRVRPRFFIVTANWGLDYLYPDPIDNAAMRKRYFEIHFDHHRQYTEEDIRYMCENRQLVRQEQPNLFDHMVLDREDGGRAEALPVQFPGQPAARRGARAEPVYGEAPRVVRVPGLLLPPANFQGAIHPPVPQQLPPSDSSLMIPWSQGSAPSNSKPTLPSQRSTIPATQLVYSSLESSQETTD